MTVDVVLGLKGFIWLFIFGFVLPVGSLAIASLFVRHIPSMLWLIVSSTSLVIVIVLAFFVRGSLTVENGVLTIATPLKTYDLPLDDVGWREPVAIGPGDPGAPSLRTMGVGLPGFQSGQYTANDATPLLVLSNSSERVFLSRGEKGGIVIDKAAYRELFPSDG
jgi:hypothetical protein